MRKLDKRKAMASQVLGVGKKRIKFDTSSLGQIKEAITKQDIKDLHKEGIIQIPGISIPLQYMIRGFNSDSIRASFEISEEEVSVIDRDILHIVKIDEKEVIAEDITDDDGLF